MRIPSVPLGALVPCWRTHAKLPWSHHAWRRTSALPGPSMPVFAACGGKRISRSRDVRDADLGAWRRRGGLLLGHALAIKRDEIHRIDHEWREAAVAHRI